MTTLAQVDDYRRAVEDLTAVATAELKALVAVLDGLTPRETRDALIASLPTVLTPYGTAASDLAATWYEDLRAESVDDGPFRAVSEFELDERRVRRMAGYAVSPLFGQSDSTVLALLAGASQRLIAGAGRDTIDLNISSDRVLVGYARIPRAGACAFCGLLASRGAVYRSAESAGQVVGRGVDSSIALDESGRRRAGYVGGVGKGVRARGSQDLGRRYHDNCKCVAVPVFEGETFFEPVAAKYREMYEQARVTQKSAYSLKDPTNAQFDSVSTKQTLANWRELFGTR